METKTTGRIQGRTIKKWFNDVLPDSIAELAINNTIKQDFEDRESDTLRDKTNTFGEALDVAFVWENTEEGHEYWKRIRNEYGL